MTVRMRVRGWQVVPVIVADDGENLDDVPVQPQFIPASGWQAFKDGGDEAALEGLRAQVEVSVNSPAPAATVAGQQDGDADEKAHADH